MSNSFVEQMEPAAGTSGSARVSLCMIVRNEEVNLRECLHSIRGLFWETVVVDTGSTDGTVAVAADFGAHISNFHWCNDFAAARNASLERACGDWIMWLDADERVDRVNRDRLSALFSALSPDRVAYVMSQANLGRGGARVDTLLEQVRLFRGGPEPCWRYRLHEQIAPALEARGDRFCGTNIQITHYGYVDEGCAQQKRERNRVILQLDVREHPGDPFVLFNLARLELESGRFDLAYKLARRSLAGCQSRTAFLAKLYVLIAQACLGLKQSQLALRYCTRGLRQFPRHPELLFAAGMAHREQGRPRAAESCWLPLLDLEFTGPNKAGVDLGLFSFKTRHNLAATYLDQGRTSEAETLWQQALAESPDYVPASLGLTELLLRQGRFSELEEVLLPAIPLMNDDQAFAASLLRARMYMNRNEFGAARQLLDRIIQCRPAALTPRILLSDSWLREGIDFEAAEVALLDVLAIDPKNADARHNLNTVRERRRVF